MSKFQNISENKKQLFERSWSDMEELVFKSNDYIKEIIGLKEDILTLKMNNEYLKQENEKQRRYIELKENQMKIQLKEQKNRFFLLKASYSFRLSQLFVDSFSKIGKNTVFFPIRFAKLFFEFLFVR